MAENNTKWTYWRRKKKKETSKQTNKNIG